MGKPFFVRQLFIAYVNIDSAILNYYVEIFLY